MKERKILRKKRREEFLSALEMRKGNHDHRSWADYAEEESISLGVKGALLKGWFFRYVFGFSQNSCLHSVSLSDRSRMLNALLIGVDEKGHKLLCSKLVLCVLAMIFIQLMPLISFNFVHVKNLFWIILPFYKYVAFFRPVLPHPGLELSVVAFFGFFILWGIYC